MVHIGEGHLCGICCIFGAEAQWTHKIVERWCRERGWWHRVGHATRSIIHVCIYVRLCAPQIHIGMRVRICMFWPLYMISSLCRPLLAICICRCLPQLWAAIPLPGAPDVLEAGETRRSRSRSRRSLRANEKDFQFNKNDFEFIIYRGLEYRFRTGNRKWGCKVKPMVVIEITISSLRCLTI